MFLRTAAVALALLAASPRPAAAEGDPASAKPPPEAPPARPASTVLDEVVGTVRSVDLHAHRITIETSKGTVELSLDRNTLVYLPRGLGTVLDVAPGATLRAGRDGDFLAYWLQVRPDETPTREAGVTPGQGSAPTRGAGPPPGEGGGAVSPPSGPGGISPGAGAGPTPR
ncbi:MAG TPA: hypothetical protein VIW03_08765 [Anaeromyxobacter sp.]